MNFKKRVNGSWVDTPNYIHNTSTDTITTLPAVIHPTGTTATVGLKGNTVQSGTPTPDNPVMPVGAGDLETVGAKAGQYKIPILSAGQTTPVYLGEVETTRKIIKYEFTGEENWIRESGNTYALERVKQTATGYENALCTHYVLAKSYSTLTGTDGTFSVSKRPALFIHDENFTSAAQLKTYLATQYANGTPVVIYYTLNTPETAVVNEPLRKIGTYADGVANVSIPVTAGGDTISVDTQVQPSEVSVNYKGWHPVVDVHKYDGNYTIATMQALTIAQLQTHTISDLQGGEWL